MWQLTVPASPLIRREPGLDQRIRLYVQLGEQVCGPGSRVLHLGEEYGAMLNFHGWLATATWPNRVDKGYERQRLGQVEPDVERLQRMMDEFGPSHFVVTDLYEFQQQQELADLLERNFKKAAEGPTAVVYDLRKRKS